MNWRLLAGGALVLALVAALAFVLADGNDPAPTTTTTVDALPSTTLAPTTTLPPSTTVPLSTTTVPPTTTVVPAEDRFQPSDIDVFSDEVPELDLRIHEFTDEEFERILEIHLEFHRWLGLHPELITEEIIEMVAVRDTDYWDNRMSFWNSLIDQNLKADTGSIDFTAITPMVDGVPTADVPNDASMLELITTAERTTELKLIDPDTDEVTDFDPVTGERLEGRAVLILDAGGQWRLAYLGA